MTETIANGAPAPEKTANAPAAGAWRSQPLQAVLTRIREIRDVEKISQSQIAREAEVKSSTLSQVLSGTYQGKTEPVRAKLAAFLEEREGREAFRPEMLESPEYFQSPTSEVVMARLQLAHYRQRMAIVVGIPGVGKTETAREYARRNPHNVWYVQLNVYCGRELSVLVRIAEALGITDIPKGNHADKIFAKVIEKLQGKRGLIIIDEAHQADRKALDGLRAIYDAAGVGIVLLANEELYARIHSGFGRGKPFAQFTSRVGIKHAIDKVTEGDVIAQARAWGIEDRQLIKVLQQIAKKPGAMRAIDETLAQATLLAREHDKPIDAQMLRDAYAAHDSSGV